MIQVTGIRAEVACVVLIKVKLNPGHVIMAKKVTIILIIVAFCCVMSIVSSVAVYFTNVACSWFDLGFGSDCAASPAAGGGGSPSTGSPSPRTPSPRTPSTITPSPRTPSTITPSPITTSTGSPITIQPPPSPQTTGTGVTPPGYRAGCPWPLPGLSYWTSSTGCATSTCASGDISNDLSQCASCGPGQWTVSGLTGATTYTCQNCPTGWTFGAFEAGGSGHCKNANGCDLASRDNCSARGGGQVYDPVSCGCACPGNQMVKNDGSNTCFTPIGVCLAMYDSTGAEVTATGGVLQVDAGQCKVGGMSGSAGSVSTCTGGYTSQTFNLGGTNTAQGCVRSTVSSCPGKSTLVNGVCKCPTGSVWNSTQTDCQCPGSYVFNTNNQCVSAAPVSTCNQDGASSWQGGMTSFSIPCCNGTSTWVMDGSYGSRSRAYCGSGPSCIIPGGHQNVNAGADHLLCCNGGVATMTNAYGSDTWTCPS